MIQEQIIKDLTKALKTLRLPVEKLKLEHPENPEHGDYATNVALATFKQRPKSMGETASPFDLANKIVNTWRLAGLPEYLAKIEVVQPGFINLWLKNELLSAEIAEVLKEKDDYGKQKKAKKDKKGMMFEYAHPNTHKQFHIGHLRTASLGESFSRMYEALGYSVYRVNYQGDVGLHVAKCLWGVKKLGAKKKKTLQAKIEFLAQAYVAGNKAYDQSEKAKKEIIEINQKVYQQDPEIIKLWKETRQWSLDYFNEIYKRLLTKFDRFYFEHEVAEPGRELVLKFLQKGVFQKSEGAIIFPGEKYGLHNRVFITQTGLPTYEAKDMALARLQFSEYKIEQCVHVVGPEQKDYFGVIFKALEQVVPEAAGKEKHLSYGWVRLKEGKMSSREGTLVEFNWFLDKVKEEIFKILQANKEYSKEEKEKIAEIVAIGAVKYSILKYSPGTEIQFDIKESINLEGDSGPYLQYTFARTQSVLRKAGERLASSKLASSLELNASRYTLNPEEISLMRTLYKFPEIVQEAGENFAPNLLCNFLYDLAQKYNLFYNKHSILKAAKPEQVEFRLALTAAVGQVLKNGLSLLGIEAPERM
jgi:arginyl-tRNA synthetase